MANYNILKAAIADYVKNRTGLETIDGDGLQQCLLSMITSLGANYQFAGIATPGTNPGTPDQNIFYIASVPGVYANFGNVKISGGINILLFNGAWSLVESLDRYFVLNDNLRNIEITDENAYLGAYYQTDGSFSATPNRKLTAIVSVKVGEQFVVTCNNYDNTMSIIALDNDFNVVVANCVAGPLNNYQYTVPSGVRYVRFGCDSGLFVNRILSSAEKEYNNTKLAYDSTPSLGGTNLVKSGQLFVVQETGRLNNVKVNSPNLISKDCFSLGYLNSDGSVSGNTTYSHSDFIPVTEQTEYFFEGAQLGSGGTYNIFYDSAFNIISYFAGNYETAKIITTPANCAYFRMSVLTDYITNDVFLGLRQNRGSKFNPIFNYINGTYVPTLQNKLFGTNVWDLKKWFVANGGWSIDSSGKFATSLLTGYSNYMQFSGFDHNCEDDFDLSAQITPLTGDGDGYFEIVIGKFMGISGTLCAIGKDSGGNYYAIYSVDGNNTPQLSNKYYFTQTLEYGLNKKISVIFKKRTTSDGYFYVTLIDAAGNIFESPALHPATYGWGAIRAYVNTGTAKIENVQFGYPLDLNDIKLLIWGHSFVEGNSIAGYKDKRWCALLRDDIGQKNVAIMGLGGARLIDLDLHYTKEAEWLNSGRYAILMFGTNDTDTSGNVDYMEWMNNYLRSMGIRPIWSTIAPVYPDGDVKPTLEAYIENHFDYVDIRPAFYDANGQLDENMFLPDHVHPSIACHEKIYQIFKAQLHNVYNL